ncbi:GntR family transcriptional regulator [Verticiella sediminum]|uniref:GntR family transcriptional regulator n=1 Tax=Verticiella sediminum TaxID=1247510 RepID=A0A556AVT9_9BURK|nr:GntR family transcriptional regulator [Verticiella sediminum]TSH96505.1 GntR family transcriptional regulator [Verticiella sediminum]
MSKQLSPPTPPEPAHARLARSSALEHVMTVVREDVRRGRYAPGARVVEAELQRNLGVSRGTVREALARLAAEGLLELHRFRGATVRSLSAQEVADLLDMREVLEGLVARKAALRVARGIDAQAVAHAQDALDAALAAGRPAQAYLQANARYHEALLAVAGSPGLSAQVDHLSTAFFRIAMAADLRRESFPSSNSDHRAITAAVLSGDAASAELLMRAHIRHTAFLLQAAAPYVDEKS